MIEGTNCCFLQFRDCVDDYSHRSFFIVVCIDTTLRDVTGAAQSLIFKLIDSEAFYEVELNSLP